MTTRPSPDHLVLLALWVMVFSVSSQFMLVAPLLPRIAEQLSVPPASLGLLVSGYALAVGVVAVVMGPVSDRVGRRRMLLAGTAVMAVALALHGFARDFTTLLTVRVLAGAGGGVLTGAAAAYVGDYFPYHRRGWALGWVMSGMAAGQILGVPIGALVADRAGFRLPFLLFGGTMALGWATAWVFLPQPTVGPSTDSLSPGGSIRHYASVLARPGVVAGAAAYLAIFTGSALFVVYFPGWLEAARGTSPAEVAAVFSVGGVATMLVGPRAGRVSDAIGRRRVVMGASLGLALLMAVAPWGVRGAWSAGALFFLLMALVAARSSALDAVLTEIVPGAQRGSMMSLLMAIGQLGFAAGGALAGHVYATIGYAGNAALAAVAALGVALIAWRFLPEPGPAPFLRARVAGSPRRPRRGERSLPRPGERIATQPVRMDDDPDPRGSTPMNRP